MSGQSGGGSLLTLTCSLAAQPHRIFDMLSEPVHVAKWFGPRGFTMPGIECDLRVGGRYRFTMQPPDSDAFHITGEFLEIDPATRLVYTFRYEEPAPDDRETTVTLALEARAPGTQVTLSQGLFATDGRLALHRSGWTDSFEKLRELAEPANRG